jgi:hypothetical protein
MDILTIISIIVTSISIIVAIIQFKKTKELEKQKFEWEKERTDLIQSVQDSQDALAMWRESQKEARKNKIMINYCCQIAQDFEYINLGGLKNPVIRFVQLKKVYIQQQVECIQFPGMPAKRNLKERIKKKSKENIEHFPTVIEKLYNRYRKEEKPLKLIIRGRAGSGKTTLLKWIVLQCATAKENFFSRFIPIYISLKDLAQNLDDSSSTNNLRQLTVNHLRATGFDPSFFDDAFENDEMIFLLDDLDDVTDENVHLEIIDWIQAQNIGGNILLITSRAPGLKETGIFEFPPNIPVYNLKEFNLENIEQFLNNWCKDIEVDIIRNISLEDTTKIVVKLKTKCEHLIKTIRTDERLLQLAANPLLLTIIAILQNNRDHLQWPIEQHELYEKCLTLMIDCKNHGNSNLDYDFKVENCIEYLSYISLLLVENHCSEIEKYKIREFLPTPMEENQLDSFLNDMSRKTGILYEAKGKYGFSNVTFQEYLAARYFAREKRPTDILEYRNHNHLAEIFKLYANTALQNDIQQFFAVIIDNLEKKEYWQKMALWEDCLLNIANENTRKEMELQLAKQVLKTLHKIPYKQNNQEIIIFLYAHYPLFKYAQQFIDDAWNLFNDAKHPFVQSIAGSILNDCDEKTKTRLINELKNRIDDFEKQENKSREQFIHFLLQNSNGFPLIIAARKNLLDFNYGLEKLKSKDLFLDFLVLLTLESLVYILENSTLLKLPELVKLLEFLDISELLQKPELPVDIDLIAIRDLLTLQDFMELRSDMNNIRAFMEYQYFEKLRGMVDEYEKQYRSRLDELKNEIDTWVDLTTAKLHRLTDQEILDYFPGTTEEDIKTFRAQGEFF